MPNLLIGHQNAILGGVLIAIPIALNGCVGESNQRSYAQSILDHPMPKTDAGRAQECSFLRSEIARQQTILQVGTSKGLLTDTLLAIRTAAKNNIAALELRASRDKCSETLDEIAPSN